MARSPSRPPLDDPTSYAAPELTADVIMKGGITSGIVYPLALCELARTYRFANIGGTSAGAIAAGLTAAAEHGRRQGRPEGYAELARLPAWLGTKEEGQKQSNMLRLFQPSKATRPLFELLLLFSGDASRIAKVWGVLRRLLFGVWFRPWKGLKRLLARVSENSFGVCSGLTEPPDDGMPGLTPWLHKKVQTFAGRREEDPPLTFADLEDDDPVTLRVMTTSLTKGRPYLLPFETKVFYFDPDELRRLFPEEVVAFMVDEADRWSRGDEPSTSDRWVNRYLYPKRPLPRERLPIVVAVRMSLSFPLLLSAVPLWAIDWQREGNREADTAWRRWARDHRELWQELARWPDRDPPAGAPAVKPRAERAWFSDGGICSNFPVHLFDELLPRWPTFAVNLRYGEDAPARDSRVELATSHTSGLDEPWRRIADGGQAGDVLAFVGALLDTMQNWTDNSMLKVPGYRDRIVHLHLAPDEGGLNLDMTPEQIRNLAEWGREAGEAIGERFARRDAQGTELSWDNHRWTRLRSSLALLQKEIEDLVESYREPGRDGWRSYEELLDRASGVHPTSYPWPRVDQEDLARATLGKLTELVELWQSQAPGLRDRRVPKPRPQLHLRPPLRK